MVEIGLDRREMDALKRALDPKRFEQAIASATKRAMNRGRVMAGDVVRQHLTIRKKFIDAPNSNVAAIRSKLIPGDPPTGVVYVKEVDLPLSEFKYSAGRRGVRITIDKTRPPLTLRHAFKATVASKAQAAQGVSHTGIFSRSKLMGAIQKWTTNTSLQTRILAAAGDKSTLLGLTGTKRVVAQAQYTPEGYAWRLPIREHFGPAVIDLVSEDEILKPLVLNMSRMFREEIGRQLNRFTEGKLTSLNDAMDAPELFN